MAIVNLTPHTINIVDGETSCDLPPSGIVARVATTRVLDGEVDGVPTYRVTFGAVTGLPDHPTDGVAYVVSGMVAAAAPRADVFSPGDLVRDDKGVVVGCRGLTRSV